MTPQASFGYSARAWSTIAWTTSAESATDAGPGWVGDCRDIDVILAARPPRGRCRGRRRARSPPADATLEVAGHLVEIAGERAGAEVLPATVREQGDDRSRRHLLGLTRRRHEDRAARRATEDALSLDEVAERCDRVLVADEVFRVEHRRIEDLRDEALIERTQALDQLAGEWLGGDDPDARLGAPQVSPDAHQRPARAESGDEHVDLRAIGEDLRAGRLLVGPRVGLVPVLVRHDEPRILRDEVLGQRNRAVAAEMPWRVDHLRAEEGGHLAALVRDVVGHDQGDSIALAPADHRESDPRVAGRRLENDRAGAEQAARLEVVDQVLGDTILDRARRVDHLELGEDPDRRVRRHPRNLDQRRVADRLEDAVVATAVRRQRRMSVRMCMSDRVTRPPDIALIDDRLHWPDDDRPRECHVSVRADRRRPSPAEAEPRRALRPRSRGH